MLARVTLLMALILAANGPYRLEAQSITVSTFSPVGSFPLERVDQPTSLAGMALGESWPAPLLADSERRIASETPLLRMAVAGLAGGAIGFLGGALIGSQLGLEYGEGEFSDVEGVLLTGMFGESILLPLGVHIANQRRGKYMRNALVSASVAAAGLLMTEATGEPVFLFAVPIVQLGAAIRIEAGTRREGAGQ